jgi:hypothetical protein
MNAGLWEGKVKALLEREFESGTRVTNCVLHMTKPFDQRPDDCRLCQADIRNHMMFAIRVNEWLNIWKDDAIALLKEKMAS